MKKRNIIVLCIVCALTIAIGIALILIISNGCGKVDPEKVVPASAAPQNSNDEPTSPGSETGEQTPSSVTDTPQMTDAPETTSETEMTPDPLEIDEPDPTPTPTPKPGETAAPTEKTTPTPKATEQPASDPTPDDGPIVLPELP